MANKPQRRQAEESDCKRVLRHLYNRQRSRSLGLSLRVPARGEPLPVNHTKLWKPIGRILCGLGFHDFRVVDVTFGFADSGSVERLESCACAVALPPPTPRQSACAGFTTLPH